MAFSLRSMDPSDSEFTARFERRHGLWIALMPTRHGMVEIVVSGSDEGPNETQLAVLELFFPRASEITEAARRKLWFSFLYRLIRIAPTQKGRLGLQFRNWITGTQPVVMVD